MQLSINNKSIETNEQGYLHQLDDWSEEYAEQIATQDGMKLYNDHWELIYYFREYYEEKQVAPNMHKLVRQLGKMKGEHFHEQKNYEKHIYKLFPIDPIHEICKLAGLPLPQPDD